MKTLMSLIFYPRGGSAQVARYLSRALMELGHEVHLVAGTLRDGDPHHDAEAFFDGIPLTTVDYTEAWQRFGEGGDPLDPDLPVPFHPSYEDKEGVPDKVFFKITETQYQGALRCWNQVFDGVKDRFEPDVLHLHHLSHAQVAAARVFPSVPKLTQLHGTEIKMLERLNQLDPEPEGPPPSGPLARRMLAEAVERTNRFAAISPDIRDRGVSRLLIDKDRITTIPNGVDTSLFRPAGWTSEEKWAFLRKILVDDPQGWDEGGLPGSISYSTSDLQAFKSPSGGLKPLILFVGRFLGFKRVPLLVRAVSKVNEMMGGETPPINLLVWGGMPGEWEAEHPHTVARELGLPNVFFCGWLPHGILSEGLDLADVLVAPSHNEPFGQVFIEAMAAGIPVIATRSGGPLDFVVESGPDANGWLAEVDDVDSLAATLVQALSNESERKRRGKNALALIRRDYDWLGIARRYAQVYEEMMSQ